MTFIHSTKKSLVPYIDQIKKIFSSLHPADQADLICSLDTDERKKLIEVLNNKIDPSLIVELSGDVRDEILGYLDKETIAGISTTIPAP